MDLQYFYNKINTLLKVVKKSANPKDLEVMIGTDDGYFLRELSGIDSIQVGFDWYAGKVIIEPSKNMYLTKRYSPIKHNVSEIKMCFTPCIDATKCDCIKNGLNKSIDESTTVAIKFNDELHLPLYQGITVATENLEKFINELNSKVESINTSLNYDKYYDYVKSGVRDIPHYRGGLEKRDVVTLEPIEIIKNNTIWTQ